jgi:hypothetical protein
MFAKLLSQHDEKHVIVIPTSLSGISVGKYADNREKLPIILPTFSSVLFIYSLLHCLVMVESISKPDCDVLLLLM